MGDETRQITVKLQETIVTMAGQVGEIHGWRDSVDKRLDGVDEKLSIANGRTDSLEKTRDENIGKSKRSATIKKNVAWGLGILTGVGGLAFGIMRMLQ